MVFFNYSTMQMAAKVVYYGPGLCGKTTNLQWIFEHTSTEARGEMVSLATETDRTLFFDLLPIDVGSIAGFSTRIQLYTVPGQVFYNTTRKLVLKGVDGVVFVADSQRPMLQANIESFQNLEENLAEMGLSLDNIPVTLQYNKRDLPNICSREELDQALIRQDWTAVEASALNGDGVFETLKTISKATLLALKKRLTKSRPESSTAGVKRPVPPVARPPRPAPVKPPPAPAAVKPPPAPAAVKPPPAPAAVAKTGSESEVSESRMTASSAARDSAATGARTEVEPGLETSSVERLDPPEIVDLASNAEEPAAEQSVAETPIVEEAAAASTAEDVSKSTTGRPKAAASVAASAETARRPRRKRPRSGGFDALAELEKLRRQAIEPEAVATANGKREISRDVSIALRRADFSRAHRVSLTLQIEDVDHRLVHEARQLHVDIDNASSLEELLLRLNIALSASA